MYYFHIGILNNEHLECIPLNIQEYPLWNHSINFT